MYLHELLIDNPETLDFENPGDQAYESLMDLLFQANTQMSILDPTHTNLVFIRLPISDSEYYGK